MRSGIVMHFTECKPGLTLASARIARFLSERYGFSLMDKPNPEMVKEYEYAVLVSSPSGFADPDLREQIGEICARSRVYVFAQNDYMTTQAGQINKWFDRIGKPRNRVVWPNMPHVCKSEPDTYINWNMLTWDPIDPSVPHSDRVDGLLYFGAYRQDREKYFKAYFGGELPYRATVSTSVRAAKKFEVLSESTRLRIVPPFGSVIQSLSEYQSTIYIEDTRIHTHYNSPANRFYEALSAGTAIFFDASCRNTFAKAGYDIDRYIVSGKDSLAHRLQHSEEIAREQRCAWFRDYSAELNEALCVAENKIGLEKINV